MDAIAREHGDDQSGAARMGLLTLLVAVLVSAFVVFAWSTFTGIGGFLFGTALMCFTVILLALSIGSFRTVWLLRRKK